MEYFYDILMLICLLIAVVVAYTAGVYDRRKYIQDNKDLRSRLEWHRVERDRLELRYRQTLLRHPMHKLRTVYEEVMETDTPITPEQARIMRSYASRLMQVQANAPTHFSE